MPETLHKQSKSAHPEGSDAADVSLDNLLRPSALYDYVGQETIKNNLAIFLQAAQKRKEPLEHILLYGPAGLGKTSLAYVIAHEMQAKIQATSGPAIEKVGDLGSLLTNLEDGDILFIDEIHRLNKNIVELLYPAMDEYNLDLIVGKGPSARSIKLKLARFTLITATTRIGMMPSPFRNRFGMVYNLDFYTTEDIGKIITRSAKILNVPIDEEGIRILAQASRLTPRIANRLLKRARDYALVKGTGKITAEMARRTLELLKIDALGLEETDIKLLRSIIEKFDGGPVGIQSLAAASSEEIDTIEEIYEPYLLKMGLLGKTPRGRTATDQAYHHLGIAKDTLL